MNNHHFEEISRALLSLANTLRPFVPQSGESALSDWCSDAIKNFNDIHKEEVRAQLLAIDDTSLFYAKVVGNEKTKPFNLTGVDVDQETHVLERELDRHKGDVATLLNLYFDQGYSPAIDYPYFHALRKRTTNAWNDQYPNADDSVVIYESGDIGGVSYVVRLTRVRSGGWNAREFKLLITHTAPWFIHPITHQEYTTIDLTAVVDSLHEFITDVLHVPLPHLYNSVDYVLLSGDEGFIIDPNNTFSPTRVCWRNGVPHLKHHGRKDVTPINPILHPEYNHILVLNTTSPEDQE